MKRLLSIQLIIFLTYSSVYGSVRDLRDTSFVSNYKPYTINDLPLHYQSFEFLKVCSLFSAASDEQGPGVMLQFYKHCVYNNNICKRLPKDVVFRVFDYLNPSYFIFNIQKIRNTYVQAIKNADIKNVLPPHLKSFQVCVWMGEPLGPFCFRDFFPESLYMRIETIHERIRPEDIDELKKIGLIFKDDIVDLAAQEKKSANTFEIQLEPDSKTNCTWRSFNGDSHFALAQNRAADIKIKRVACHAFITRNYNHLSSEESILDKNTVTIYERNGGNVEIALFKFDDYVKGCFYKQDLNQDWFAVELIDEKINMGLNGGLNHSDKFPFPKNHRVEIYDIKTRKKLSVIPLPLTRIYTFDTVLYSLVYLNAEALYFYDHRNRHCIELPYACSSFKELMNKPNSSFDGVAVKKAAFKKAPSPSTERRILRNCVQIAAISALYILFSQDYLLSALLG